MKDRIKRLVEAKLGVHGIECFCHHTGPVVSSTGGHVQNRFRSPYAKNALVNKAKRAAEIMEGVIEILTVIHPGNSWPALLLPEPRQWVCGLLS